MGEKRSCWGVGWEGILVSLIFAFFLVNLHGRIRRRASSLQKGVDEGNSYSTHEGIAPRLLSKSFLS